MYTETRRDDEVRLAVADRFDHAPDRGFHSEPSSCVPQTRLISSISPTLRALMQAIYSPLASRQLRLPSRNRDCLRTVRTLEPACTAAKGVKPA